jgi:hypothetical protein
MPQVSNNATYQRPSYRSTSYSEAMEGFMYSGGVVDHLQAILPATNEMHVFADYGCIFRASSHMPTFRTDPVAPRKRNSDPIFRRPRADSWVALMRGEILAYLYETSSPHGSIYGAC